MKSSSTSTFKASKLELLSQMGRIVASVNRCKNTRELIASIHAILSETFYVDNFYVVTLKQTGQLEFPYFVDSQDKFTEAALNDMSLDDIRSSLTFYALTSNMVVNFDKDALIKLEQDELIKMKGTVPEQWLSFPIDMNDESLGAIVLQSYRDNHEFNPHHIELFSALSRVISAALVAYQNQAELEQQVLSRTASLASEKRKLEHEVRQRQVLQTELQDKVALLETQNLRNEKLQEQLQYQASHDHLTGLANRHELNNVLSRLAAKMHRTPGCVYLLFIDLDGFKAVNDGFGHDAGDYLLVRISERLKRMVRGYDLVARIGGDEFVILIEQQDKVDFIDVIARRVIEEVSKPVRYQDIEIKVGASVGVACSTSSQGVSSLVVNADHAMYQAKEAGKSQVVWFQDTM